MYKNVVVMNYWKANSSDRRDKSIFKKSRVLARDKLSHYRGSLKFRFIATNGDLKYVSFANDNRSCIQRFILAKFVIDGEGCIGKIEIEIA